MLEHGAYAKLRDRYYVTEAPIPEGDVYRQAGARSKEERAAVEAVLSEFYKLDDGFWRCPEFDAGIIKARKKIGAAKANGKSGGRPKKNQDGTEEKPSGLSVGSENESEPKALHPPSTTSQEGYVDVLSPSLGGDGPTPAGLVCRALKAAGISAVNPSNALLGALLQAGATTDEFIAAAGKASDKSRPFEYLLTVVQNDRQRAKEVASTLHVGAMPSKAPTAAELRVLQAAPGLAAPHLRAPLAPLTEVFDVAPKRVG